jgi:ribonuclease HIII
LAALTEEEARELAAGLFAKEVFDYLPPASQKTLLSGLMVLEGAKRAALALPRPGILLHPFASVFDDCVAKILFEKGLPPQGPGRRDLALQKLSAARLKLAAPEPRPLGGPDEAEAGSSEAGSIGEVESRVRELASALAEAWPSLMSGPAEAKPELALLGGPLRPAAKEGAKPPAPAARRQAAAPAPSGGPRIPKIHVGTDESGKGDYFGPLVVAGVYCDEAIEKALLSMGVKDSKMSSDYQNLALAEEIAALLGPPRYEIDVVAPSRYNVLYDGAGNLNKLLADRHALVIDALLSKVECGFALVDQFGPERWIESALAKRGRKVELLQIPRAESDPAVAAASILARAAFLTELREGGDKLGISLPKGASSSAEAAGRRVIQAFGPDKLREVAKLHFKNTERLGLRG